MSTYRLKSKRKNVKKLHAIYCSIVVKVLEGRKKNSFFCVQKELIVFGQRKNDCLKTNEI